jgi:hypothetical protein
VVRSERGSWRPGTKIRRVVTSKSAKTGEYWLVELPESGKRWREDFAVLEDWSKNGFYIEFEVPPDARIVAWEGKTATQFQSDLSKRGAGQYLAGGGNQLFIDFGFGPSR